MSELIQKHHSRATIRRDLLIGASALVIAAGISSSDAAKAEDISHPSIWIELGGQFAQQENNIEFFSPPFLSASQFDGISQLDLEKGPTKIWNEDAKITFQPKGSDWVFSADLRYGRASRNETRNQITAHPSSVYGDYNAYQYSDVRSSESHTIVDFEAGKDVGLGKFGSGGSSVISLGVRYAQFNSSSNVKFRSRPDNVISGYTFYKLYGSFAAKRKFTGIGPSLSWDASALIAGNPGDSGISLDWGVNGAILFGRQRVDGQRQATDDRFHAYYQTGTAYHYAVPIARNKNVIVPNLGGFAGLSWRAGAAKVSAGYRADMFFGAMDGGIDTAKKENAGFYGPFATVSVGLGG